MATCSEINQRVTEASSNTSRQPLRVLIVEDNPADAELITATLKREGYVLSFDIVDSAEECRQGLQRTDYDIILSDHNLLTWTGMDALEILQQSAKDIPFIVVTATLGDEAAVEYIKRGAADYVLKSRLERLPSVVGRVLSDKALREETSRLQEQILDAKREWELTFDTVPDAVLVLGGTGCVQRANRAAVEALGWKEFSDLIGKPCSEIVHGQNPEPPECPHCQLRQSGKAARHEIEEPRLGKIFDGTCTPLRDSTGAVRSNVLVLHDITERKRAEEATAASETRYRRLFETAQDGILILDAATGEIVDANSYLENLLRYTHQEILGKRIWEIGLLKDVERSKAVFKELQDKGQVRYENLPLEGRDGRLKQVEFVSNMYTVDQAKVIQCNIRDITERMQAEEFSREKAAMQEQLSTVVATVPGVVYSFQMRPDGTTCMPIASSRMRDIFDLNPEDVRDDAAPAFALIHPDDAAHYRASIVESFDRLTPWHEEFRVHHPKRGLVWVEGNSLPARQADGSVLWHGFMTDITNRKQLESQFRQAQKMEAVGQLAGGVAHDFNNMLNIILGYAQLMGERLMPEDPMARMVDQIRKAGDRAASLTRQLLAFSRKQVLQPKVLDLNVAVAETEKLLRRLIGEDIEVVVELDPAVGSVKADQGQLDQVIMNLAVNARDAMPNGGKLLISTANADLDESYAHARPLVPPGRYVRLTVSDTGVGMDRKTQSHIFEPFFTTKEVGKGTGLGLATVYGTIKQNGGFIWVYSEPGMGTTFKIYLPRVDETAETHELRQAEPASVAGHETVLIAEDEEDLRALTHEFLCSGGYTLLDAKDGQEALELAAKHQGPIHLLVTDVIMPGMSGRELIESLAATHPGIKVLLVSGYPDKVINHNGFVEVGAAFLEKPFSKNDLLRKVRELLDAPPDNDSNGCNLRAHG